MEILSIQVGKPKMITFKGIETWTGVFKDAVLGPVEAKSTNLAGDGQGDLQVHGGVDKAIYAYSADAYLQWKKLRPQSEIKFGAMGENLTVDSLPEDQISVGDRFSIGSIEVEASEPRFPCSRLGLRFNDISVVKQFMVVNRPGVYFRVIKEGKIQAGDRFILLSRALERVTIQELFEKQKLSEESPERLRSILKNSALTQPWREKIEGWLKMK